MLSSLKFLNLGCSGKYCDNDKEFKRHGSMV